jgi:capsular polysaccharide transport system permease protein
MNNEERIRKWLDERQASADVDVDAGLARLNRPAPARAERRVEPERGEQAPSFLVPDDASLDAAKAEILERRRQRWYRLLRRAGLFAGLPLLAVFLYASLIATPLYQGEAVFTVQTSAEAAPSPSAGLFALGGSNSTIADAFKAREFILSRPMMEQMEKRHGFLSHFATYRIDPLTRFQGPLGRNDDPYRYYLKRVKVAVDVQEGLLHLYVQARTKEDAVRFGNAILAAAEEHVNGLSQKISNDQIAALTQDVQNAERQVAETQQSLAAVQARRGELNPEQSAAAVYQLISQLELQRSDAQRERDSLLDQGLTNSPLLPRLEARLSELKSQIAEQRSRLVSPGGTSLQTTINEFQGALARKEIAQARWQSTLNTLQQAYLRILQERRYFVIVVGMSVPTLPAVRDVTSMSLPILFIVALLFGLALVARRAMGNRRVELPATEVFGSWRRR